MMRVRRLRHALVEAEYLLVMSMMMRMWMLMMKGRVMQHGSRRRENKRWA